jgi:hypothetical protein
MKGDDPDRTFILALEHIEDHRFEVGILDIGFAPGAAATAKVVNNEIHILVVVVRDDRRRPTGPTHDCNSNATRN